MLSHEGLVGAQGRGPGKRDADRSAGSLEARRGRRLSADRRHTDAAARRGCWGSWQQLAQRRLLFPRRAVGRSTDQDIVTGTDPTAAGALDMSAAAYQLGARLVMGPRALYQM